MKKDLKKANRLIDEKSPYLLQHAHNPVDWYPWGEEAFFKAKDEDKPVFLSIGYSTCHWCHVMAHESFEDKEVAGLMNNAFVCIKVDREERPDIDSAYMTAAQAMTGSGGWPLTIIMTPEKKPFFAATYIPKETRYGRAGMMEIVPRVKKLWETDRERLMASSEKLSRELKRISFHSKGEVLGKELLKTAFVELSTIFDAVNGGFGRAPKFPTPHNLLFLLRYWRSTGDGQSLSMVERTLDAMRKGGVYDHLGFGFHRYSTDEKWLVPHFEKMLYDQALLVIAFSEAYQATKNVEYMETAKQILSYIKRDMTSAEGVFYSAEDADSEGVEGKFYLWTEDEIKRALSEKDAEFFLETFNIKEEGNFSDEALRRKTGQNIPHLTKPFSMLSVELDIPLEGLKKRVEAIRKKLFLRRERRVHPEKDDKVLTDWNGLMIAAFAVASRVFDNDEYRACAKKAVDFILKNLFSEDGRLLHLYKDDEASVSGFLEDYAFFVWGLLEVYEATFDPVYLKHALSLSDKMVELFWDDVDGGFYHTSFDSEELFLRKKEVYDGAVPSGNSVAMHNLIRLSRITGDSLFEERAVDVGKAFSETVKRHPSGYAHLLSAVDFLYGPSHEIVVVGEADSDDTMVFLKRLNQEYIPRKVVVLKALGDWESEISSIAGYIKDYVAVDGRAAVYVCSNHSCKKPTTDPGEMMGFLGL